KHVIPVMEKQGGGAIVNIASTSGLRFTGNAQVGYAATKAGVIQLSRVVAVQYAPKGIRVNTVVPGQLHTPMVEARLAKQRAAGARRDELGRERVGPLAPGEGAAPVQRNRHREGLRLPRRAEHRPRVVARQGGKRAEVDLRRDRGGHPTGRGTRCRARMPGAPKARERRSARCSNAGASCRASSRACRGK